MIEERDVEIEAEGAIQVAIRRLAHGNPFHSALIATFRVGSSRAIETAAVTIRQNEVHLLYCPDFVAKCTLPELEGVLHHELNHVIFGHVFLEPGDYPDDDALIIATEVTVNEFVHEPLPGKPILLSQFPDLPTDESTDERYCRLSRWCAGRELDAVASDSVQEGQDSGHSGPKQVPDGRVLGTPQPLDDHALWAEARASGDLGRLIVRECVRTARDALTAAQIQALPAGIEQAVAAMVGDDPGDAAETVGVKRTRAKLDWSVLLRRYIRRVLEVRPSFNRPPRRFPALVGIVPGHAHRHSLNKPVVMAVLDTSASIDGPLLQEIGVELNELRRRYRVTVVECDAEIHAVYELTGPLTTVHGRGGTDFRPPFENEVLRRVEPDVVVYFTDGCGPAPSRAPRVPVIWCLTADGERPSSWGRIVRLL